MAYDIRSPFTRTKARYNENNGLEATALWCAVLERAIDDLYLPPQDRHNSLQWFLSDSEAIGSLKWICYHIDIDRIAVVQKHATRIRFVLNNRYKSCNSMSLIT